MIQRVENNFKYITLDNRSGSITISDKVVTIKGMGLMYGIEVKRELFDDFVELILETKKEITA